MKIVVFDLDETLGYFVEFKIFWECLLRQLNDNLFTQEDFNNVLNLYPEFLRPNIYTILNYLKIKKEAGFCEKVMIYTNNQSPKTWVQYLINYLDSSLNYKLFDQIICAFKVNGKRVEMSRTSQSKTYSDLLKCTKIPANTEICFLDDKIFPDMSHDNVYYIYVKPYRHDLNFLEMIERLNDAKILPLVLSEQLLLHELSLYNYNYVNKLISEYEVDKIISKEILAHLRLFFISRKKNKTFKKRLANKSNKTFRK